MRATAFGIPYAIAIAAFGGTAPYIMSALSDRPHIFTGYVVILLIVSTITILTLKESRGINLREHPDFPETHEVTSTEGAESK